MPTSMANLEVSHEAESLFDGQWYGAERNAEEQGGTILTHLTCIVQLIGRSSCFRNLLAA